MEPYAIFLNKAGRLRSGWRTGIFVILFAVLLFLLGFTWKIVLTAIPSSRFISHPLVGETVFRIIFLTPALIAAWVCNRFLEGLPWRSFGLGLHARWWWDFLFGSVVGAVSLILAVAIGYAAGSLRFNLSGSALLLSTSRSMAAMLILFVVGALGEEALFRGYPLQTLTRARLAWLAVLLTSLPFAAAHLNNPNVVAGFTFINTALAGVWLAVAYLRTRSLWFPLGIHWAWNWFLGPVFGIPVSGLRLSNQTFFTALDNGPAWLTGGTYGIEGGAACTVALVLSTFFIWRTKWVSATPELLNFTSQENPAPTKVMAVNSAVPQP